MDSIGLLQLVDYLESKYKIEIPMEMITPGKFRYFGRNQPISNKSEK